jgi:1,2-dihydroxy-3-keto-5-methylthiopentene dioxygenase
MSRLTVYTDTNPDAPLLRTEDPVAVAKALQPIGVRFERWDSPVALAEDAAPEAILDAYRPYLDGLMGPGGAGSADVIRLTPDNPAGPAMRQKFLSEHIHTEDEIRFFVRGAGSFVMHVDGKVFDAYCTQGDLISVPAGIKHWFDAGESPSFTALRVFQDTTGWTPHYTGDAIAERFPVA